MIPATHPPDTPAVVELDRLTLRDVRCPCGVRHLAQVRVDPSIPAGMVFHKLKCTACGNWTWFDLATGEPRRVRVVG